MKKKFSLTHIVILFLIFSVVFSISIFGCKTTVTTTTAAETTTAETTTTATATTAAAETTSEKKPITLTFWTAHSENDPTLSILKKAADKVKEQYNITVNIVPKGTAGYRELMTATALSQSGPDIMFSPPGLADIITAGRQGLFSPLNNLLTKDEINSLSNMAGTTDPDNGDIYGIPYTSMFDAIAVNKDLFNKAGIDYNSLPSKLSYKEFIEVCEKLKKAGIVPFGFANKEGYFADWWQSFFVPSYFDKIEDAIPTYQQKPIYKEPFISFNKNWKEFYEKGYYLDGGTTIDVGQTWEQLFSGKVAMQAIFPNLVADTIKSLGEDKVGIIEWPAMGDGALGKANPVTTHTVGVTKWSENKEAALLYIKTLVFDQEIVKAFADSGSAPTATQFKMSDFNITNPVLVDYYKKHDQMATYPEGHNFWTREFSEVTEKFCNLMLTGEISIEKYCSEIESMLK